MAKTIQLLLTESVDNLGIVGDVVHVKLGYARNFLLPRTFATQPSQEKIAALADKRAKAEAERSSLREQRRDIIDRLNGYEIQLVRACNDLGVLYGGVTQNDIAEALAGAGFSVRPRDVRLPHAIKRVDAYDVSIKFDSELETAIRLKVEADRELGEERVEMEFDDEGELIDPNAKPRGRGRGRDDRAEPKTPEGEPEAAEPTPAS